MLLSDQFPSPVLWTSQTVAGNFEPLAGDRVADQCSIVQGGYSFSGCMNGSENARPAAARRIAAPAEISLRVKHYAGLRERARSSGSRGAEMGSRDRMKVQISARELFP